MISQGYWQSQPLGPYSTTNTYEAVHTLNAFLHSNSLKKESETHEYVFLYLANIVYLHLLRILLKCLKFLVIRVIIEKKYRD